MSRNKSSWQMARLWVYWDVTLKMAVSFSRNVWSGWFIVVLIFVDILTRVFIVVYDFRE